MQQYDSDIIDHNRQAWDRQAHNGGDWSRPVDSDTIAAARQGRWQVRLTPSNLPGHWLGDVTGKEVLCLASAGGQQAPVLSAVGGRVTVFDVSPGQLNKDREVALRDGLALTLEEGDMRDLSRFADASFDIVFHPISNLYVPDIRPVWKECARVLRPGGRLLSSFYNPVVFVADRNPEDAANGLIRPRYRLPYSDLADLDATALAQKREKGDALAFGHSLTDQIAGQIDAGLLIAGFYEDDPPSPRFLIDRYLPTFLATLAVNPRQTGARRRTCPYAPTPPARRALI
ncbi:hypothetical protein GCM10011289_16810 [Paludibacterium paludis]|uniref:Methyltransferase type 11 domain-containing protein n=2 Tax=Paludibacterium paludis TaxID=1225769 RepID=A0A918U9J7_9NEIS|nr:hypothetical protein GCM10011289_16810 [Paludibacterium paludis]